MSDPTQTAAEARKEEEENEELQAIEQGKEIASKADVLSFSYDGSKCNILFTSSGVRLEIKDNMDTPHAELTELMDLMSEDLAAECEVESTLETNPVIFTKFTVSEKKGRYGYKLIGKRVLAGARSPMSIVSCLKWNEHADTKQALDPTTVERLEALQGEIRKHLANLLRPVVEQTLFGTVVTHKALNVAGVVETGDDTEFEDVTEDADYDVEVSGEPEPKSKKKGKREGMPF